MKSIKKIVNEIFSNAINQTLHVEESPVIQLAARSEFGDYQANFAMALSKRMQKNPREVASQVVDHLKDNPIFAKLEIAGPGFINISLENSQIDPAPSVKMTIDRECVLGLGELEGRMVTILNLKRVQDGIKKEMMAHVVHNG